MKKATPTMKAPKKAVPALAPKKPVAGKKLAMPAKKPKC